MARRKFDEDVVEETTTEVTETVSEGPDTHEQFVTILVDMGLSAEQAEAVHSMAMDLINAGGVEETTDTEVQEETKVEASRTKRGTKRSKYARNPGRSESPRRSRRSEMSTEDRTERRMRRLMRQNADLKKQLVELGARPAAQPLRNRPDVQAPQGPALNAPKGATAQALEMINKLRNT